MAQKVALITAGTAGLGAQIARVLAPDFRLVGNIVLSIQSTSDHDLQELDQAVNFANNRARGQALIEELHKIPSTSGSEQSPRFELLQADVGDRPSVKQLVEDTITKFGRLDVVVSNAGWTRVTNFNNLDEGMEDEDWDKCFLYNVKSHLWLMHAAKTHLESSEGAFITTASIAGVKPSGSSLPYSVTKAAAIHLSKALAIICSPKIRVNSVSPGLLLTDWGLSFGPEKIEKATKATKLQRLATVEVSETYTLAFLSIMDADNCARMSPIKFVCSQRQSR
ncbi:hypothetical protein LTR62_001192 [Meristemomyces frigidus]|uniref:NAD(P)-binding protein n=1 Tax=Meristemomyces frigidus TaxID=1508187 RepID=A0AAN7TLU5_9PEZI|nr:hypothetical protein LTR62_001192 [Meristemomyces frigidus]